MTLYLLHKETRLQTILLMAHRRYMESYGSGLPWQECVRWARELYEKGQQVTDDLDAAKRS